MYEFIKRWLYSTNHKDIGTLYFLFGAFSGFLGTILSGLIRLELSSPGNIIFLGNHELYNVVVTAHGWLMVIFMVAPILVGGFGNWLVPVMIGAPDMSFPRLNNISFWLLIPSLFLLLLSFFAEISSEIGIEIEWYPLSSWMFIFTNTSVDYGIFSLYIATFSWIISAINFITTICCMRARGLYMVKLPLFVWSILITSLLLLITFISWMKPITCSIILEIFFKSYIIDIPPLFIKFKRLFWFFCRAEFYVMIIPAVGLICEVIQGNVRKKFYEYTEMIYSISLIGVLCFGIWLNFKFVTKGSLPICSQALSITILISVPVFVIICIWLESMYESNIIYNTSMLFVVGFIFSLVIGGFGGLFLAGGQQITNVFDPSIRTVLYFVVGHFHYILAMSTVFSIFAGFYFYFSFFFGIQFNEFLGKIHFLSFFIGVNLTFFPMHFLGLAGMWRRDSNYSDNLVDGNLLSSYGASISFISLLFFFYLVANAFKVNQPSSFDFDFNFYKCKN